VIARDGIPERVNARYRHLRAPPSGGVGAASAASRRHPGECGTSTLPRLVSSQPRNHPAPGGHCRSSRSDNSLHRLSRRRRDRLGVHQQNPGRRRHRSHRREPGLRPACGS